MFGIPRETSLNKRDPCLEGHFIVGVPPVAPLCSESRKLIAGRMFGYEQGGRWEERETRTRFGISHNFWFYELTILYTIDSNNVQKSRVVVGVPVAFGARSGRTIASH